VITENEITISPEGHSQELKFEKRLGLYYLQAGLANQANMVAGPDRVPVNINDAHLILGHVGETLLRKTALHIGCRLNGQLNPCPSCMLCKSTAKRVRQDTIIKASKPGERIFLDITGPFKAAKDGHQYWAQMTDNFSPYRQSVFMKQKSEVGVHLDLTLNTMKTNGLKCRYIRCDNARENKKQVQDVCLDWGIQVEFTAPYTPQQNGVVERSITVTRQMADTMGKDALLSKTLRQYLWPELVTTATTLANISVPTTRHMTPQELFLGKKSTVYRHLHPFGQICYVAKRNKIKRKSADKSYKCIYLGPAFNAPSDACRLYCINTQKIRVSRDVRFAKWHRGVNATADMEGLLIVSKERNDDASTLDSRSAHQLNPGPPLQPVHPALQPTALANAQNSTGTPPSSTGTPTSSTGTPTSNVQTDPSIDTEESSKSSSGRKEQGIDNSDSEDSVSILNTDSNGTEEEIEFFSGDGNDADSDSESSGKSTPNTSRNDQHQAQHPKLRSDVQTTTCHRYQRQASSRMEQTWYRRVSRQC
jgi:Integrase core domain